jgi:hypothetical protein
LNYNRMVFVVAKYPYYFTTQYPNEKKEETNLSKYIDIFSSDSQKFGASTELEILLDLLKEIMMKKM